jgi:hypothetical protein
MPIGLPLMFNILWIRSAPQAAGTSLAKRYNVWDSERGNVKRVAEEKASERTVIEIAYSMLDHHSTI